MPRIAVSRYVLILKFLCLKFVHVRPSATTNAHLSCVLLDSVAAQPLLAESKCRNTPDAVAVCLAIILARTFALFQ